MTAVIDLLSWTSLVAGGAFCVVGAVGMLRMPDFYTRMHAASVLDTLGAGLILLGLLLQAGPTLVGAKLVMIGLLLLFANPAATHALARAALLRGVQPLTTHSGPQPPTTNSGPQPLSTHPQEPPSKP